MKIAMLVPDNRDEFHRFADPEPYFGPAPTALLEGLAGTGECEIHIICCAHTPLRSPETLAENIHYHSLVVPIWGWLRGGYVGCIQAIRRKLREVRPDLVHGQGTERYCAVSAVLSGFPNVLTVHGNMRLIAKVNRARPFSFQWLAARLERFSLPRSDGVVCLSSHTRLHVEKLARKTWVVPNAVDSSFFAVQHRPDDCQRVICAATVCSLKNQAHLIQSLDPLAARRKFELVFYGGASREDPYVQQFFRLLETRSWCQFAGLADKATLQAALARAALLVLPSLEDNCPMVILEAMASGVPVAAARVGGVPDLIDHGINGLLFDPKSEDQLRDVVSVVLQDEGKALKLAGLAREKAVNCYHPKKIAQRHLEVYDEIIGAKR